MMWVWSVIIGGGSSRFVTGASASSTLTWYWSVALFSWSEMSSRVIVFLLFGMWRSSGGSEGSGSVFARGRRAVTFEKVMIADVMISNEWEEDLLWWHECTIVKELMKQRLTIWVTIAGRCRAYIQPLWVGAEATSGCQDHSLSYSSRLQQRWLF